MPKEANHPRQFHPLMNMRVPQSALTECAQGCSINPDLETLMATFDEFIGSLEKEAGELVNYFNNHGPHCGMSDNHREPHIGLFIMDEWDNV